MANRSGEPFGPYRLVRFIKAGGFGEVYEATHPQRGRVALKLLKGQLDEQGLQDFLSDVRAVLLRHPHIIEIVDFGVESQTAYLAMPYFADGSLRARHPRGTQLPLATIAEYVGQIAEALQYAHDHGTIHRDVKPDNVLLRPDGILVLADFGIAVTFDPSKTHRTAEFAGSLEYAAPEQFEEQPGPASDQYALATMVYEWLSGKVPFPQADNRTPSAMKKKKTQEAPPRLAGIAPAIEEVVLRALAIDPHDRFSSVQAFAGALTQAGQQVPDSSPAPIPPPPPGPGGSTSLPTTIPVSKPPITTPGPLGPAIPLRKRGKRTAILLTTGVVIILLVCATLGVLSLANKSTSASSGANPTTARPTATATPKPVGLITEFALPSPDDFPEEITAGPDSDLWFTEDVSQNENITASKIGRMTITGVITEFPLPHPAESLWAITSGPDGNLWFAECMPVINNGCTDGQIGRVTPSGQVTEFPLPTRSNIVRDITAGPDGNLWFTEYRIPERGGLTDGKIGRITPTGAITEFPMPAPTHIPFGITAGPDDNLWFTESEINSEEEVDRIGRITPSGAITEFSLLATSLGDPFYITTGPDNALWFTSDSNQDQIGRITPSGEITQFSLPPPDIWADHIVAGPDGNLWFTEDVLRFNNGGGHIGRITPSGVSTEFSLPSQGYPNGGLTAGPDGNIWFCTGNKIGRVTTGR